MPRQRKCQCKELTAILCVFFFSPCRLSAKTQKMMMKVTQMTQKLSKMRCWLSMQEKLSQIWARPWHLMISHSTLACCFLCFWPEWLDYVLYAVELYLLTYSMEQSPSWVANRLSASQVISHIVWNPRVHYHIHNCLPPVPLLIAIETIFEVI